jgi:NH3-dependent NAD+ synthetase
MFVGDDLGQLVMGSGGVFQGLGSREAWLGISGGCDSLAAGIDGRAGKSTKGRKVIPWIRRSCSSERLSVDVIYHFAGDSVCARNAMPTRLKALCQPFPRLDPPGAG